MQKYLFIFLVCIGFSGAAYAQRIPLKMNHENFFRFGAKAGVNVNRINGQSYTSGFHYNYQLGGFLQFNITKRLGIQPEVNLVQSAASFSKDPNDIYEDIFYAGSQRKGKLNYLEIPLLLNINIGPSKRIKLQVGPSFGSLLKETLDSLQYPGNVYKKAEWSAIGGLWIQLPLIHIGARYKLGFTNINAIDDLQKWKSEAIQFFAGITF